MKICICTTPIRPVPTVSPPFGSMAIIQSLRKLISIKPSTPNCKDNDKMLPLRKWR